ncbi:MAG: ribonuclease H-like domain-containing protein [Candidatus Cloacimonetes bacterium]|nr:ribonuclease H-like domain-containing protein [Candidatus Cloacimonadota bacterium]
MNEIEAILKNVLPANKRKKEITQDQEIHDLLPGKYIAENVFLIEKKYQLNSKKHANKITKFDMHPLLNRYTGVKETALQDLLFIDTETTGLTGGTGTYVFLIGVGYFSEAKFVIKQYFLTDVCNEKDLIEVFAQELNLNKIYVSFNGKSFDIPLLNTRSIFHKCNTEINCCGNIDLLHISRRIWKDKLNEFSLQNIEHHILKSNRNREKDIPGSAIPDAYFNYLINKNANEMKNVIQHNKLDILNLAVLLGKMNSILFSEDFSQANTFQIGRIYLQSGYIQKAVDIFKSILTTEPENLPVIRELSMIYKSRGEFSKAAALWEKAMGDDELYAHVELAKLEEHKNKNFTKALEFTEKAILSYNKTQLFDPEVLQKLRHRQQRILKKLELKKEYDSE